MNKNEIVENILDEAYKLVYDKMKENGIKFEIGEGCFFYNDEEKKKTFCVNLYQNQCECYEGGVTVVDDYKGINAKDFKKVIVKMMDKYGEDIVFEWNGDMRIVDFENNYKDCIRQSLTANCKFVIIVSQERKSNEKPSL